MIDVRNRKPTFWTGERTDKLKEMVLNKRCYAEIGKYFGKSEDSIKMFVSRNKINREMIKNNSVIEQKRKISDKNIAKRLKLLQNLELRPEEIE